VVFARGVVAAGVEMLKVEVEVVEFEGGVGHGLSDEEYVLDLLCAGEGCWRKEAFGRPYRG
jgi:hypothetical protein